MVDLLIENDHIIESLQHALRDGTHGLTYVPPLIKRVITEGRWTERTVRVTRERAAFPTFAQFVRAALPDGLGTDVATLKRVCAGDTVALDLIDQAERAQTPHGGDRRSEAIKIDNINLEKRAAAESEVPSGTAAQYALRRLRKDRPDLHAQVLAGTLSGHAAMVAAGFRKRTITVPLEPEALARVLRRHLGDEELATLATLLTEPNTGSTDDLVDGAELVHRLADPESAQRIPWSETKAARR